MTDHSSGYIGSVSILGIHGPLEFRQQLFHSFDHVMVDTADGCPTVNQSSGHSNSPMFCFVKFDQDGDTSFRGCGNGGVDPLVAGGLLVSFFSRSSSFGPCYVFFFSSTLAPVPHTLTHSHLLSTLS